MKITAVLLSATAIALTSCTTLDPEYAEYHARTMKHWERLKDVVAEDIEIYDQLERTKRSSGYTRHILNERECKIAHYHENMDRKIQQHPASG